VAKGDVIRFVLGRGQDYDNDLLAWMPIIRYEERRPVAPRSQSAVRIHCGSPLACTDSAGNRWNADCGYRKGRPVPALRGLRAALSDRKDAVLYARGRTGKDFTYSIPVLPGVYAVRLKFCETRYPLYFERPMRVEINGVRVLNDFDISQAGQGWRRGVDKAFHHVVPDAKGNIVIRCLGLSRYDGRTAEAMVQAIEILPEFRSCVRINAGSRKAFVDWNSFVWSADRCCSGGRVLHASVPVRQASPTLYDQPLYQTARAGRRLRYRIPVQPGLYAVHLKFAELWLPEKERRPMRVEIQGETVLRGFDPASADRRGMSSDRRFERIAPDARGIITITVIAEGGHDAILQGIEID
jgi:hypothetical protein